MGSKTVAHAAHGTCPTLKEAYRAIRRAVGDEWEFESFQTVQSVERHRIFWKPVRVRTLLLAESHIFTRDSAHDCLVRYKGFDLAGCPRGYVKLVYCLGYGEKCLTNVKKNRGTPNFWKIFASCLYPDVTAGAAKILVTKTRNPTKRINNKISILNGLRGRGIWLADASIVALYKDGKKPKSRIMKDIIRISWEHHVSEVILHERPEKIVVVGKGVHSRLKDPLSETGIPVHVQPQPRGTPKAKIPGVFARYYRLCNGRGDDLTDACL